MKASYKLAAVLALMCIAGCALRPAIGQGEDCAAKDNTTCAPLDTNTGCCFNSESGACQATTAELVTSLDFDGICRIPQVLDTDAGNADEACTASALTLCEPGSETEPAGCTVSKCFTTFPPLAEGGLANWTAALKGEEGSSTLGACYSGLNWMGEGVTGVYEGGSPVAIAVPFGQMVTMEAPAGDMRPFFRISRLNVTMVGNFSVTYKATTAAGVESEGDLSFEGEGDFLLAEGYPRGPLYSLSVMNGGDSEETKLHINRYTLNVC